MQRFIWMSVILTLGLVGWGQCHGPSVAKNEIFISKIWAREGKPNSAAFMRFENKSSQDRKIIGVKSDVGKKVELHDHIKDGDVMRMRQVSYIDLPAGQTVDLKPGGKHVMFFGLGEGLKQGQDIKLTLILDDGAEVDMNVPVKPLSYKGDEQCPCTKKMQECPCTKKMQECPCTKKMQECPCTKKMQECPCTKKMQECPCK